MQTHDVLFGLIAWKLGFVAREGLIAASTVWAGQCDRSLADLLVERQALSVEHRELLVPLVDAFLRQHGGDAQQCVEALSSVSSVHEEMSQLLDPNRTVIRSRADETVIRNPSSWENDAEDSQSSAWRFQILRPHAKGGLGQVSVARDLELNREVALKEIQQRHLGDAASRERFILEAEITGGLQHPGIVPVYGLGRFADGSPFYAMRFIRGDSLKAAIEDFHRPESKAAKTADERKLELRKLLGRLIDVCNAMDYAHSRGVLHRDLKPGNIMLGKYGETLVVDWGLAKAQGRKDIKSDEPSLVPTSALSSSDQTRPGSALGTPAYMSPEQAAGRLDELGPETDVYSLGATLYHLLTGQAPFRGPVDEVLQNVAAGMFAAPRYVASDIPAAVESICQKAMSLKPSDRYHTPRDMADDLERWMADEPVLARSESWSERFSRLERKHRTLVRAGTLSLVAITLLSSIAAYRINQERNRNAQLALAESKAKVNAQNAERVADTARVEAVAARGVAEKERARADDKAREASDRAIELKIQLAQTLFQHSLGEYKAGRRDLAINELSTAWVLLPEAHPLRDAYGTIYIDRLLQGGSRIPSRGGLPSPDRSQMLVYTPEGRRFIDTDTMQFTGAPLTDSLPVSTFKISPNHQHVVGVAEKGVLQVWDTKTKRKSGQWNSVMAAGGTFEISPNSDLVVSTNLDGTAQVWDIKTCLQRGQPLKCPSEIFDLRFSPNAQWIATNSRDGTVGLWDAQTGSPVGQLLKHERFVTGCEFSPDSTRLLTASSDQLIRVWDTETGNAFREPVLLENPPTILKFHPQGYSFSVVIRSVALNKQFLQIWRFPECVPVGDPKPCEMDVSAMEYSPDGSKILLASSSRTVSVLDSISGDLLQEYEDMGRQSVFHPDGLHILGDSGFTSEAFSVPPSRKQMTTESISGLAITPDGSRLLVASGRDVTTCDSQTYEGIRRIAQEDSLIDRLAISSDGQKIVTGTDRQSEQDHSAYARVRDSSNGDLIGKPMRHPDRVMGVSLSPDGTRLATVCFDGGLRIWNGVTGDLLEEAFAESMLAPGQPLQGPARAIAFGPDGKMLAFGSFHRSSLWSLSPLKQIRELETSQTSSGGPIHLSFSPDGTRLLSVYSFGTAQLWDVKTGQPVGEVIRSSSEGSGGIKDASFSPDGSLVVVAMLGDVRFFDAWTGVPVRRPFRYTYVTQLEFSPDGSRLISGDTEGNLRVWETTPLPMPKNLSDMLTRHAYQPGQRITLPPFPGLEHSAEQTKTCREEWMSTLRDWQNDRCRKYHLIAIQDAQDRENWFAVEFHLRQLLRIDPNNAGVQNRHQYAKRRLDQPFIPRFTDLNQDEYQWDVNIGVRRGLRPSKLVVSAKDDAVFYSGEFVPIENRVWWARHGITKDEFERTHAQHTSNGLTLDCHSFVTIGEREFHAAVWLGK